MIKFKPASDQNGNPPTNGNGSEDNNGGWLDLSDQTVLIMVSIIGILIASVAIGYFGYKKYNG
jgi:hypothetical protein